MEKRCEQNKDVNGIKKQMEKRCQLKKGVNKKSLK